jgi:hypothetical protein
MERMMDVGSENTIKVIDEFGRQCVRIFKPIYYPEYAGKSINFEDLKRLVKSVKKHIRDPKYIIKDFLELKFPPRLKLPYRIEDSNI